MSQVKGALDIMNGIDDLFSNSSLLPSIQPVQMIPNSMKDDNWVKLNVDFLEFQGLQEIESKAKRLIKNYNLAYGILDREDYIPEDFDHDMEEVYDTMMDDDNPIPDSMDLQFFPLIPTYYNVLLNEYTQRGSAKIEYRAMDENSVNEIIELKQKDIEKVVLDFGKAKMTQALTEAGYKMDDPEVAKQLEVPNLMEQIPAIDNFYKKDYRNNYEIWANKMHKIDTHRFNIDDLERDSYGDYIITDSSYWHINLLNNDYRIELLNPVLTFSHKSPNVKWASEGNYAGFFNVSSIGDVIDICGEDLDEENFKKLESMVAGSPVADARFLDGGIDPSTNWDASKTFEQNKMHSIGMMQNVAMARSNYQQQGIDIIDYVLGKTADEALVHNVGMLRMTTVYWKSQKKLGMLFEIKENGESIETLVDENFVQQINPIYNNKFTSEKSIDTLVFGQHIDWFYVNETWGARKISGIQPVFKSVYDNENSIYDCIYLGIGSKKPGPIKCQFKSDLNRWGSRLPIEGGNFSNRLSRSKSMVDLLKPSQILFNIANNQITDIMADELGPVVALDQNSLPKHSMDGSWGKHNYVKARGVMGEYQILPLDNTLANIESPTSFSHMQVLDMTQTNRLLSRINISRYAKEMANDLLGFSPARNGQQVGTTGSSPTATELEQTQVGSYNRTETYFINHADKLMPRIHELRTTAAQYYFSNKPSFILQQMIDPDERALFEIDGTDLVLRDFQVFCDNNSARRSMLSSIKDWVMKTNTNGAGITDGPMVMQTESLVELDLALKKIEAKQQKNSELEHQRKLEILEKENQSKQQEIDKSNNFEALQNMLDRQTDLLKSQIMTSGYAAMQDINKNSISDQVDLMKVIKEEDVYKDTMRSKQSELNQKAKIETDSLNVEREKINADLQISANDLLQAKINRNRFDKK